MTSNFYAIIPAGGSSQRMGSNKLLHLFNGKEVLIRSIETVLKTKNLKLLTIACLKSELENYRELISKSFSSEQVKKINCIQGGSTREESVKKSIESINNLVVSNKDFILIHDAARCLLSATDLENICNIVIEKKAVTAGSLLVDTIKKTNHDNKITTSINRENVWKIETPQVFLAEYIIKAHKQRNESLATDDVSLLQDEVDVYVYETKDPNLKFTKKSDAPLFKALLEVV